MSDIWLSAQRIVDIYKFLGVKITKPTILSIAKRQSWEKRCRKKVGGGFEFNSSSLPKDLQNFLNTKNQLSPETLNYCFSYCGNWLSKSYEERKFLFSTFIENIRKETKQRKTEILKTLEFLAKTKNLPPEVASFLLSLKQRKNSKSLSLRFLFEISLEEKTEIINLKTTKADLKRFLMFYQNRKNPTVAEAWRAYKAYQEERGEKFLGYSAVLQRLKKLPDYVKEEGRKTGSAMKALKTYSRRDWQSLRVNDCWASDGHSLHAKIKHPITGKAFRPEITLIIDCHSRYIVGWSVSFAENTLAVANALQYGMENCGVPLIYYSDNGAGQTNKTLDDDCTGILARLGVEHQKAIAGNPQARGIIERLMRSLGKNIAKQFPTYFDKSADQESTRKMLYAVNSGATANAKGKKELSALQKKGLTALPTWEDLLAIIKQEVKKYNNTPLKLAKINEN